MPTFTDDQLEKMLQMDFGTQEQRLAQQNALTQMLRQHALQPSARLDKGSQIARGLQGLGAVYAASEYDKGLGNFGRTKQQTIADIFRKKPEVPVLDTPRESYTTPGVQDFY